MKRIKQSVVYWPGDFHCERPMQHEDADFVFRGGRAFPKALTCGNYSTPQESPYGFGAHVVKGPIEIFKGDDIVCDYNDRLRQFYPERWSKACKHLTSRFEHCKLSEASAFLSVLYQFEVKCLQIVMGCNVSNGYPYYIFISRRVDAADPASGDVS